MRFELSSRTSLAAMVAVACMVGLGGMSLLLSQERIHDRNAWQEKLNTIADSRSAAVSGWVETQFRELTTLSENASLQLYFTMVSNNTGTKPVPQADYLRSLLNATATRLNYAPATGDAKGGLALLDMNGKVLAQTNAMPALEESLVQQMVNAPKAENTLLDIMKTAQGAQQIGFVIPVYAVQADHVADSQIGLLVGIRPLDAGFFSLLKPEGAMEKSLEVTLVRNEDGYVRYLTPLMDGSSVMAQTELMSEGSAAGFALSQPNAFDEKTDYRHQQVLSTGRNVALTPWVLLAKIDTMEAYVGAAKWRVIMLATTGLLLLGAGVTLYGMVRPARGAMQSAMLSDEARARADLMDAMMQERGQRLKTLQQLVDLTVSLIDSRDPHASKHSSSVALVAAATAQRLGLDVATTNTTETAARLMNIGKMDIPTEWLTRAGALNDTERSTIRSSMAASADLLEGIAFDGPVADTLRQAQERLDGSGPQGLKGEEILISARIVAAANALVGMLSPRSYRPAMPMEEAVAILNNDSGTQFDRNVVNAMIAYMQQGGGQQVLQSQQPVFGKKSA